MEESEEKVRGCRDFGELILTYLTHPDQLELDEWAFIKEHRTDCEICDSMVPLYEEFIMPFKENPNFYDTLPIEQKM